MNLLEQFKQTKARLKKQVDVAQQHCVNLATLVNKTYNTAVELKKAFDNNGEAPSESKPVPLRDGHGKVVASADHIEVLRSSSAEQALEEVFAEMPRESLKALLEFGRDFIERQHLKSQVTPTSDDESIKEEVPMSSKKSATSERSSALVMRPTSADSALIMSTATTNALEKSTAAAKSASTMKPTTASIAPEVSTAFKANVPEMNTAATTTADAAPEMSPFTATAFETNSTAAKPDLKKSTKTARSAFASCATCAAAATKVLVVSITATAPATDAATTTATASTDTTVTATFSTFGAGSPATDVIPLTTVDDLVNTATDAKTLVVPTTSAPAVSLVIASPENATELEVQNATEPVAPTSTKPPVPRLIEPVVPETTANTAQPTPDSTANNSVTIEEQINLSQEASFSSASETERLDQQLRELKAELIRLTLLSQQNGDNASSKKFTNFSKVDVTDLVKGHDQSSYPNPETNDSPFNWKYPTNFPQDGGWNRMMSTAGSECSYTSSPWPMTPESRSTGTSSPSLLSFGEHDGMVNMIAGGLPKFDHFLYKNLPSFTGEHLDWTEFFELFKETVDKTDLKDVVKLSYLKQKLDPKTRKQINSYTSKDYANVKTLLENLFTSPANVMVEIGKYVRSLPDSTESPEIEILEQTVEKLRAITSLFETYKLEKSFELDIFREFTAKIPERMSEKYTRTLKGALPSLKAYLAKLDPLMMSLKTESLYYRSSELKEQSHNETFSEEREWKEERKKQYFLRPIHAEVEVEDSSANPRADLMGPSERRVHFGILPKQNRRPATWRSSGSVDDKMSESKRSNDSSANYQCQCCDSPKHTLMYCPHIEPIERFNLILHNRACFLCFEQGHQSKNCPYELFCDHCNGSHNSLICINDSRLSSDQNDHDKEEDVNYYDKSTKQSVPSDDENSDDDEQEEEADTEDEPESEDSEEEDYYEGCPPWDFNRELPNYSDSESEGHIYSLHADTIATPTDEDAEIFKTAFPNFLPIAKKEKEMQTKF